MVKPQYSTPTVLWLKLSAANLHTIAITHLNNKFLAVVPNFLGGSRFIYAKGQSQNSSAPPSSNLFNSWCTLPNLPCLQKFANNQKLGDAPLVGPGPSVWKTLLCSIILHKGKGMFHSLLTLKVLQWCTWGGRGSPQTWIPQGMGREMRQTGVPKHTMPLPWLCSYPTRWPFSLPRAMLIERGCLEAAPRRTHTLAHTLPERALGEVPQRGACGSTGQVAQCSAGGSVLLGECFSERPSPNTHSGSRWASVCTLGGGL